MLDARSAADKRAAEILAVVREVVGGDDATLNAYRILIESWEREAHKHEMKVAALIEKENALQDRIEAQQAMHKALRIEVDELRQVLAEQLSSQRAVASAASLKVAPEAVQFARAAALLIQPGRKLTGETLKALGIPIPPGKRPSEHYARSIATIVLPALGFEILDSRGGHPDLVCRYQGEVIGVEVEVGLRDYDAHGHDAADAHVVACWQPPNDVQMKDGMFEAATATPGYSRKLAVITLQSPQLHADPFATGTKRFSYSEAAQ